MLNFKLIKFDEFRENLSQHLWPWQNPEWIPFKSNPYGIIQYYGEDIFTKVRTFPIAASIEGKDVAWTSIYNLSDTHVRIRGLFVLPEHRGNRIAERLLDYACSLWPSSYHTCIGLWREDAFKTLQKHWGLEPMSQPQHWKPAHGEEYTVIAGFKKFTASCNFQEASH